MQESHYIFEHDAELKRLSEMVFVEGGTFRMGSEDDDKDAEDWEKPAHDVTIDSFYIGKYPVTQVQWKTVMKDTEILDPSNFKSNNYPVECISREDIQLFIEKIYAQTGKKYRLPTEAEWEYAAKGGRYFKDFPFIYSGSNKLNEVGWYGENSHGETKSVGLKLPNFLGIHDMSGSLYEWCSDFNNIYQDEIDNPIKYPAINSLINPMSAIRGGCFSSYARLCRPTFSYRNTSFLRNNDIGFRLVFDFS
jgi:formylglycine-generating enzyme